MGGIAQVLNLLIHGFFALVMFAVVVGLIFLLVRFLLVATKAARIYIDQNGSEPAAPPKPAAPTTSATRATPATSAAAKAAAPKTTSPKPRSTPRQT
jgi:cell division protein FtsN